MQVLAFKSSGVHSNGFSLVRKVLEVSNTGLHDPCPWEPTKSIGEVCKQEVLSVKASGSCFPSVFIDGKYIYQINSITAVSQVLLTPTFIYVKKIVELHEKVGAWKGARLGMLCQLCTLVSHTDGEQLRQGSLGSCVKFWLNIQ